MRTILTISLFLFCTHTFATNKFFATAGSDLTGTGTSALPYKSITKLNSIFSTLVGGDTVFFRRGDTFSGVIVATAAGSTAKSIVISAYGTGALPVISGFVLLHNWTLVSGSTVLWECTPDSTLKATVNVVTIAGIPQAVGRTDWMTYDSAKSTGLLWDQALIGAPSYVGAEVVIRKGFVNEKMKVTAQGTNNITVSNSGMVVLYPSNSGVSNGTNGWGFFFQRFVGSLDKQGEWFFNSTTNKMRMYSTTDPNNLVIKASYKDTLFMLSNRNNITIENLNLEGANMYGIHCSANTNVDVKNCTFRNNTIGVYNHNSFDLSASGCDFDYNLSSGIFMGGNTKTTYRVDVTDNVMNHTGTLIGMGVYNSAWSLRGIMTMSDTITTNNWVNVINNKVLNTGSGSIQFQGSNVVIRRNVTDTMAFIVDDMGGIYTFINNSTPNITIFKNRIIDSNFIGNAPGAPAGAPTGHKDVVGLYLDDQTDNVNCLHNSIWNIQGNGSQINNPVNITLRDNNIYNTEFGILCNEKPQGVISGLVVKKNAIIQKNTTDYIWYYSHWSAAPGNIVAKVSAFVNSDSNYISNLNTNSYRYHYVDTTSPKPDTTRFINVTLANWRTQYGHDVHSALPVTVLTSTNTAMYRNPAYGNLVVPFIGLSKVDPQGNVYNNSVTIPSWSSIILIDNGNAPTNQPPVVNAGTNQSIVSPASSVTLTGSATDADGTISTLAWTRIDGPNVPTIVSPAAISTQVNGLVVGVYHFQLQATDNAGAQTSAQTTITVTAPANTAPTANAGADKAISLPATSVSVTGTATDPEAGTLTYLWAFVSGPATTTFGSATALTTTINGMTIAGTYQISFKATDPGGLSATDFMSVVVSPNIAPIARAGSDQVMSLPANSATLDANTSTDADGTISSYTWTQLSGPSSATITVQTPSRVLVSNMLQGVYVFDVAVQDNGGLVSHDAVQVTINPAANSAPTVSAGTDKAITLPVTTTSVTATATDPEGGAMTYLWTFISGPVTPTFGSATALTTTINGMSVAGTYQFNFKATDAGGLSTTDLMQVVVSPAIPPSNIPPVARAGNDQVITLPANSAILNANASTDADGSIVSYTWTQLSGPSSATITVQSTTSVVVSNMIRGVYVFDVAVQDNGGAVSHDALQVTIDPAANAAPSVNAGTDKLITLPVTSTSFTAIATDPEGGTMTFLWTQQSGPVSAVIGSSGALVTSITGLTVAGIYVFTFKATDPGGLFATDMIQVTVSTQPNQAPIANAGPDQVITLPVNNTILDASGSTDPGRSITTYTWTQLSGPTTATMTVLSATRVRVSNLIQGAYLFDVAVQDDGGLVSHDAVQVQVNPAILVAPVAVAGADREIYVPKDSVILQGSSPDLDIVSIAWSKYSGPAGETIVNPASYTTAITGLRPGTYLFKLTVTDSDGVQGSDFVQVTVRRTNPVTEAALTHGWKFINH